MITVTSELLRQFDEKMRKTAVADKMWGPYKKWLRYYLDFCQKYNLPPAGAESLPSFASTHM